MVEEKKKTETNSINHQKNRLAGILKRSLSQGAKDYMPVILATQEAEIRRTMMATSPGQTVPETVS
jgi:hypothetical protein